MTKDTKLSELVINKLTTAQYDGITTKDPNQIYIVTDAYGFEESITNCLTKIPQDIKLELNNGTLTLKAGSKVYMPNGVGVFDEVTITADVSFSNSVSGVQFICYSPSNNALMSWGSSVCSSGNTMPSTQYFYWYDTTNNLSKVTDDYGSTIKNVSLPLAICSASGGITSIDKVFNGFGYIGSTVFALPGVKGLIPDGRNENGTLKNDPLSIARVWTFTNSLTGNHWLALEENDMYFFGEGAYYDSSLNMINDYGTNKSACLVGTLTATSGVISNFNPKTTFNAVDYNDAIKYSDKSTVVGWGMPDYSAGISISSGFVCPSAGVIKCYVLNGLNRYSNMAINNVVVAGSNHIEGTQGNGNNIYTIVPVSNGDNVTSLSNVSAVFYPLKGAK